MNLCSELFRAVYLGDIAKALRLIRAGLKADERSDVEGEVNPRKFKRIRRILCVSNLPIFNRFQGCSDIIRNALLL